MSKLTLDKKQLSVEEFSILNLNFPKVVVTNEIKTMNWFGTKMTIVYKIKTCRSCLDILLCNASSSTCSNEDSNHCIIDLWSNLSEVDEKEKILGLKVIHLLPKLIHLGVKHDFDIMLKVINVNELQLVLETFNANQLIKIWSLNDNIYKNQHFYPWFFNQLLNKLNKDTISELSVDQLTILLKHISNDPNMFKYIQLFMNTSLNLEQVISIWDIIFPEKYLIVHQSFQISLIRILFKDMKQVVSESISFEKIASNLYFQQLLTVSDLWEIIEYSFLNHYDEWLHFGLSRLEEKYVKSEYIYIINQPIICKLIYAVQTDYPKLHRIIIDTIVNYVSYHWIFDNITNCQLLESHLTYNDALILLDFYHINHVMKHICIKLITSKQ